MYKIMTVSGKHGVKYFTVWGKSEYVRKNNAIQQYINWFYCDSQDDVYWVKEGLC